MSVAIKDIVDYLRGPPFHRSEGLVDVSKKSPLELLQLVSDVFAHIDDRQKKDVRDEQKEAMTARMLEFVTVLGYKIEGDIAAFGDNFMRGNPSVIYPFLLWTLQNFEKLRTRAYLARYLRPFSIPEEHFADLQIVNMYQQYQERQSEFKERHMQLEDTRHSASQPQSLQQEVTQLENEKEQLVNKLEKLRSRLANDSDYSHVNFDEMLTITNKLRQEQELEAKLYNDLQEQRDRLQRAEAVRHATARKLQDMNHSDMANMDPHRLISKLADEVRQRRDYLDGRLEADIADREKQLRQLSKLAGGSLDQYRPDDIRHLEHERHDLREHVEDLLQRRENSASASDSKIAFVRDRLANVEKRKEKLHEQISELDEERRDTEADLKKAISELKAATGAGADSEPLLPNGQPRPKTDTQMKEYMNELNRKTQRYKALKAELEAERQEVAVLSRTEEILRSRAHNIGEFNAEQEKKLGVVGFGAAQDQLEAVSAQKADVDSMKGDTLEELSAIIERINASIKEKKDSLQPQIAALRAVRADHETVENIYNKKKTAYDNSKLSYESEVVKLEAEVAAAQAGQAEEESQYHLLHSLSVVTGARLEQVRLEEKGGAGLSAGSFSAAYERAIAEQESVTKTLRQAKKTVGEKHEIHVAQRAMFSVLKGILNKKLEVARTGTAGSSSGSAGGQQQSYAGFQQQNKGYGGAPGAFGAGGYGHESLVLEQ